MIVNGTALNSICDQIKALEKNSVSNVIKIGNLLEQAFEQCEYGQWCDWLKDNFGWSLTTARRYRDVCSLVAKSSNWRFFDKMEFSLSALYLAADLGPDDPRTQALFEAALKGRVTRAIAIDILEKLKPQRAPPPPPPPPTPPPIKSPPDQEERGESGDDAPPPDDIDEDDTASEPDTASESVKLLRRLNELLRAQDRDWARAIEAVGSVNVREIVNELKRKLDQYSLGRAIKAKADAAEATASGVADAHFAEC
jgi:Protein of unknown function (DUF3102)